jgi:hypothetical protein
MVWRPDLCITTCGSFARVDVVLEPVVIWQDASDRRRYGTRTTRSEVENGYGDSARMERCVLAGLNAVRSG